ncbi:MAG: hypothetical protein H0V82_11710 [Candidatus Protochlamydia sp.]|nr:hypothetical protein [Candidatus Protochlamydia sp.]
MSLSFDELPSKFHPYLLGHPSCASNLKEEIDQLFQAPLTPLKGNYIFTAGRWIIKGKRSDGLCTTEDTHIYRISKAEKIRRYISENHLENHLVVPQKFLYWNNGDRKFYVICEKLNLSQEVAQPESSVIAAQYAGESQSAGGQCKALAEGFPQRSLTIEQAKALANISILGLTDLSYNNAFFTTDGKFALLDTEPQKRSLMKKTFSESHFGYWMGNKDSVKAQQTIAGIAKLKTYCRDEAARREIEKIENRHFLWNSAKIVGKIAMMSLTY